MFILCGIAEEPTWPGLKPSVTSSCPAISRMVLASDDGAGGQLHQRGDHVVVERTGIDLADGGEGLREAEMPGDALLQVGELAASPPSRSSMSCAVPTGPLMPRSG